MYSKGHVYNYLYFAPLSERFALHHLEKKIGGTLTHSFNSSYADRLTLAILDIKPTFESFLKQKNINTILIRTNSIVFEKATKTVIRDFFNNLMEIENLKGSLHVLLLLKNWAFFPENQLGAKNRSRHAATYLKLVVTRLQNHLSHEENINNFLNWCVKKTRKLFSQPVNKKSRRSPPQSAIQIYYQETAEYLKYFLNLSLTCQQSAEMTVYLALSQACARFRTNYFNVSDIIEAIHASNIIEIPLLYKLPEHLSSRDEVVKPKSKSETAHENLSLKIPSQLLQDEQFKPGIELRLKIEVPPGYSKQCKVILVGNQQVLISERLASAISLTKDTFSLTKKIIAHRLNEAYGAIGLSQSSGKVSPLCFYPHPIFGKTSIKEIGSLK